MRTRKFNSGVVTQQYELRRKVLEIFSGFEVNKLTLILKQEEDLLNRIESIKLALAGLNEEKIFKCTYHLFKGLFHFLKWTNKEFNAIEGSERELKAARIQIELLSEANTKDFNLMMQPFAEFITLTQGMNDVKQILSLIDFILQMSFPIFYTTIPKAQFGAFDNTSKKNKKEEQESIVSVLLQLGQEPWANPQVIQAKKIYSISGEVTVNRWPKGYKKLIFEPVSITENKFYTLNILAIKKEKETEAYNLKGEILFHYSQSTLESPIEIKLFAYFSSKNKKKRPITIIGYHQLKVKVFDDIPDLVGNKNLDRRIWDLMNDLQKEGTVSEEEDLTNFIKLLSGIINYQGYCLQEGTYKNIQKLKEDIFRDNLIKHLYARNLSDGLNKEPQLAGGRVEILYRNICAELKVETKIKSREDMIKKYVKQPVVYASGKSKELGILCILDLTEKDNPSAGAINNIMLVKSELHGFEDNEAEYPIKIAVIFIDGNTKNPSQYSI